jgi:hypothetical protein
MSSSRTGLPWYACKMKTQVITRQADSVLSSPEILLEIVCSGILQWKPGGID